MNINPPSLPSLKGLPFCLIIDSLTGYLYAKVTKVDPYLVSTICAVRSVSQTFFYLLATLVLKNRGINHHKIFIVTSTTINLTFIIALKQLNLIGKLFSFLLSVAVIGQMIRRVKYIQDQGVRV